MNTTTYAGHLRALGLLLKQASKAIPQRPLGDLVDVARHKFRTFAPGSPNRRARRGAPLVGVTFTDEVPVWHQPYRTKNRLVGRKLAALRAAA